MSRALKVALVCDWYAPRLGGIETQLADLAATLRARGHEPQVITATPDDGAAAAAPGVVVHRLGVPLVPGWQVVGSRRAYVYIPRSGGPTALVHAVDAELWRAWPAAWGKVVWVRREELARELTALVGGRTVAMEYSPGGAIPYGDYVPAGTLELVRAVGATPVSSAELVTR